MLKKYLKHLLAILIILLSIVSLFLIFKKDKALNSQFNQSTVPTLFFHGFGSSIRAENHMVQAAVKEGVTSTVIQAIVSKDGKVRLKGNIPKGAINPIVQVGFEDNRNPDYHQDGRYAKAVVDELQKQYQITEMNMVGHSMGNMSLMFYLLDYGQDSSLPKLLKQVDIAGHFNGIEGLDLPDNFILNQETGQPNVTSSAYQDLLKLRETYPKNQVEVLNIYGNLKDNSDGSVLNDSSKSLNYLVSGAAKSYQEYEMTGKLAQHSQLHENPEVDRLLIDFLWGKKN